VTFSFLFLFIISTRPRFFFCQICWLLYHVAISSLICQKLEK
jgi:hypothetical protein